MNYKALTKTELIQEIEKLKRVKAKKPRIIRAKAAKPKAGIVAGCEIQKDDLLVVDEENRVAFVHPEVKTVAGKVRIHGYAVRSFKKGQLVRMHNWWEYEPK